MPAQRLSQTIQRLEFNEKLVQSGKKESNEALLKRIKTLHQKLKALEQDNVDVKSLESIRKPLIHNTILHHKDRGVKAYAACCLADILRLTAPDAPYSATELRDIFQFFTAQIKDNFRPPEVRALQVSKNKGNDASQSQSQTQGAASQRITDIAYYAEYHYLLESLATIKSVVLAVDAPGGDGLVTGFFETFVDIVRPDMSKGLIRHLVSILSTLLEECATVHSEVMDIVVTQFENKASPPDVAFQLIVDVCNSTSDKLQRPILAHFTDIQLKHGRSPSQEDLKTLGISHKLLLTIYRHAPGLLLNVVPVLEENLRAADEVPIRQLSTRTLGKMFGERPVVEAGTADLARAYPAAWRAWLGRRLDKATAVRLAWVESSRVVLVNHPELRQELEPYLIDRIEDSSEVVRAAICKVICSLEYETVLHQISEQTLRAVGLRMSDKKANVRIEAATGMAKLWSGAYSEIEANEPTAASQFGWIPEAMFQCLQKDVSIEMRVQMTATIKQYILPLPEKTDDAQAWVDRLMMVATHLDDSAFKSLEKMTGLRGYARGNSPYRAFIEFCEANNGGIIDENEQEVKARLSYIINAMAKQLFPEPEKARKDMEAFAAANESRLYKLFKACADPHSDLKTLIKARNEFVRRIEQSHSEILDTFTTLINNASFNIVNPSSISPLIRTLSRPGTGLMKEARISAASRLLSLMAKECAPMYRSHVAELGVVMTDKKTAKLAEVALQALAALAKVDSKSIPSDQRYIEKARKMALEGTPRQGKFAARFLSYHADEVAKDAIETIADALEDSDNSLLANLRVLSEFALSSPANFETKSSEIHDFIMRKVIHKQLPAIDTEADVQWIEEAELPTADQAKLMALRLITHRVLGFARASNAMEIAKPVLDLLDSILANEGATDSEQEAEGEQTRAQLRLRASLCALKLANVKVFDKAMGKICERIAWVMKDPVYHVRFNLLLKFATILPMQRLLPRWNIIPAMIALDPSRENLHMAKSVIASTVKACSSFSSAEKIDRIELPLARLLWLLASDAEVDEWSLPDLKDFARYIELYLDCIANRDNVGLLFQIGAKIKSLRTAPPEDKDAEKEEAWEARATLDKRFYKLSELAQIVIRNRADVNHWNITPYPGTVRFPKDIFHNLANAEEMHTNSRKSYLNNEEVTWAKNLGRKAAAIAGPSRRPAEGNMSPVKRTPGERKVSKKRARKSNEEVSDESEDEDDDDEVEGEEDELESEEDAMSEVEDGDGVVGRGGKRGAKTKAKKGLRKKSKSKKVKANGATKGKADDGSSELSEMDDE